MKIYTSRKYESYVYLALWVLVVAVYLLDIIRVRSYTSLPLVTSDVLIKLAGSLWTFMLLFLVNNLILIPRLLLRNRFPSYFAATALIVIIVWGWQAISFTPPADRPAIHHHGPAPLFPLPVFLDFIYDILIVGVNIAVALMFQRYHDRLEAQRLKKADAESRLSYLKAQINPHFYMNMLNNIHGMIEINPAKAQDMVLDMSALMRYMLYDSSRPMIALDAELDFVRNYLRIMRLRYPENKVRITADMPPADAARGIRVPPLIFLVYIENAFKHGVSFRQESFVSISIAIDGASLMFRCVNSNHASSDTRREGIGLANAEQRLRIIYGQAFSLDINSNPDTYSVCLSVPAHENKDLDN